MLYICTAAARITSTIPQIVIVRSGRRVELQCAGAGPPSPVICWTNGSRRVQSSQPERLTIERVSQENAGIYRCHAVNHLGRDVKQTRIGTSILNVARFNTTVTELF